MLWGSRGGTHSLVTQDQEKSGWSWWERLWFWGPVPLGIVLLITGDTVERILGAGMVAVPTAALAWATWHFLRERRDSHHPRQDDW